MPAFCNGFKRVLPALVLILPALFCAAAGPLEEADYESRSRAYLESLPGDVKGAFGALALLSTDRPVRKSALEANLIHVNSRLDCSDFIMAGMLRLMYLYGDDPRLPADGREALERSILDFKFWIDEPGKDSMCYWSENHQVLFNGAEYLAGALYPDRTFSNSGMTGAEHREKGKRLLERWFDRRERYGFSEWFSNIYYTEDIFALANVYDFAPDPEMRVRAAMALDQLALNMALNSFKGNFICTHGRTSRKQVTTARGDDNRRAFYILFGRPDVLLEPPRASKDAVALATSGYRPAAAVVSIALDDEATYENYQAHGFNVNQAEEMGESLTDVDNGMLYWGMGMYAHEKTAAVTAKMWREWKLYDNAFFMGMARLGVLADKAGWLDDVFAARLATDGAYLHDAHTYTYRTPDYILSCLLDWRPGEIMAQNLVWTAGMGPDAVIFTQHPGKVLAGKKPSYWNGNGAGPRAAQYKNVLVAIYNPPSTPAIGETWRYRMTHAWFPRAAFDRVERMGNWTFAKKDKAYAALYSKRKTKWKGAERGKESELVAPGMVNVWLIEMGREAENGTFEDFMDRVSSANLKVEGTDLRYESPSLGAVEFAWTGPFKVDGREIPLIRNKRYYNPYVSAERYSDLIEVNHAGLSMTLDFRNAKRIVE